MSHESAPTGRPSRFYSHDETVKRHYGVLTQEKIGQICGVTRQRVQQIIVRLIEQQELSPLPKTWPNSPSAVAEKLGVSSTTICEYIHKGTIQAERHGKSQWRITEPVEAIERRMLRKCRVCEKMFLGIRRWVYCSRECFDQATQHWNNFNDPTYRPRWMEQYRLTERPRRKCPFVGRKMAITISGLTDHYFDQDARLGWIPRVFVNGCFQYRVADLEAIRQAHQDYVDSRHPVAIK